MKVSVIGGGGHVGLGMCLVLADAGHLVYGVDIDQERIAQISAGQMPFGEEHGEEYLRRALESKRFTMGSDVSVVKDSEVIVIVIGTPVDQNFNPDIGPLHRLVEDLTSLLQPGQLLVLRSTVSPGSTDRVRKLIQDNTEFVIGENLYLVFAAERVAEGKAITELTTLPQLIGAYEWASYARAEAFFKTFLKARCLFLTPLEVEIGKLITNMTRYVTFALSNEYHFIAETLGVNINKIIDACNLDYPRLNLPSPGPNVGGPCLYKDGWFLIERIPYNELISTAFRINEGMPMQIVQKLRRYPNIRKVSVLGMTFKANSDDTRNSVSFKIKKQLETIGYHLTLVEPNVDGYASLEDICGSDAMVLMTPHNQFTDLSQLMTLVNNPECLYVDIWGFWKSMRHISHNGYFFGYEAALEGQT